MPPPREARTAQVNYQQIKDFVKKLECLYDAVEGLDCVVLDRSHRQLSILRKKLQLNDDGTYAELPRRSFFEPLSVISFNAHPVDLDQDNGFYRFEHETSETATHLSY